MKKKILALALVFCLALALGIGGTLAYLTSTDTVTNTFTVGNVSIKLDEAKVGTDGKALTGDSAERVKENSYKLMPGHTYDKDPTVTVNAGSEESYIKVVVTVNKTAELDKIFKAHEDFAIVEDKANNVAGVVAGYDSNKWTLQNKGGEKDSNGNRTYTFYYYKTVSAVGNGKGGKDADEVLEDLFTSITIPGSLTNEEIETLQYKITQTTGDDGAATTTKIEEKLSITVTAYAIQADGFTDAADAWSHFPTTSAD